MSEMEDAMGGNEADYHQMRFGDVNRLEAMSALDNLRSELDLETVKHYPAVQNALDAIAPMTEADLIAWANLKVPDRDPVKFEMYLQKARHLHNAARDNAEMEEHKPPKN